MRISVSRGRTYRQLIFVLLYGPACAALFLVVTDSLGMLVVPIGLTVVLLLGIVQRLRTGLILDFSKGQIAIQRGTDFFTIPRDAVSAVGVVGQESSYHLAAWIPTHRMTEFAPAVRMLNSRPPSEFGDVTAVPLIHSREIGRKRTLMLRRFLESNTEVRWRSASEQSFRDGHDYGIW